MDNKSKCINLLNRSNNSIEDCIAMINSLEQLRVIVDNNIAEQVRTIYHAVKSLEHDLEDELESLNEN